MTEEVKVKEPRKIRFWIGTSTGGTTVTAVNKKLLRAKIDNASQEDFKGTKIKQFEISYSDHADLALKLMGASISSLSLTSYAKCNSEYDA